MFLSLLRWVVLTLASLYLTTLKEKQLENISTRQKQRQFFVEVVEY